MKLLKIALVFVSSCLLLSAISAQTVIISGTQTKQGQFFSSKLESDPTNIPRTGKIVKIEGEHKGFWINKNNAYRVEKTYRFPDYSKAKGETLSPGTYTVYPNLPRGESKARVKVYIELEGGQSPSTDSSTFYRNYCKVYVPAQSNMYKDMDKETYQAMKSAGAIFSNVGDCAKKSIEAEQQYYSKCLDEGKTKSQCDEVVEELKEMYRMMSTRQGCTDMNEGFCGFYNLEGMKDVPEEYKADQGELYQKCMSGVDKKCRAYPETISW